jgi:mono/diheme cytochrome c family protein
MKIHMPILILVCAASGCGPAPVRPVTGAETFAVHCASCHGPRGEGDGPVAATMRINVPNLRALSARNGGQFPADAVASYIDGRNMPAAHGDRLMPVWGGVFDATGRLIEQAGDSQQRISDVIDYLRTLQN